MLVSQIQKNQLSCLKSESHLATVWTTQCAAVRIHWFEIIEPPQNIETPAKIVIPTCQGQDPGTTSFPPTIRGS